MLTGSDPLAVNDFTNPRAIVPETEIVTLGKTGDYAAPAHSVTVLRFKPERASGN